MGMCNAICKTSIFCNNYARIPLKTKLKMKVMTVELEKRYVIMAANDFIILYCWLITNCFGQLITLLVELTFFPLIVLNTALAFFGSKISSSGSSPIEIMVGSLKSI
jgi:hypothetical protein